MAIPQGPSGPSPARFRFEHPRLLMLETYALVGLAAAGYFGAALLVLVGRPDFQETDRNLLYFQIPLIVAIEFLLVCAVRWLRRNQPGVRWLVIPAAILLVVLVVASPFGLVSLLPAISFLVTAVLRGNLLAFYPVLLIGLLWARMYPMVLFRLHLDPIVLETPFGRIFVYDLVLVVAPLFVLPLLWPDAFAMVLSVFVPLWFLWMTAHLVFLARQDADPFAPLRFARSHAV